jgi:hypothetical protein
MALALMMVPMQKLAEDRTHNFVRPTLLALSQVSERTAKARSSPSLSVTNMRRVLTLLEIWKS